MQGWAEEIFYAKFQSALLLQKIGLPSNIVIESLLDAYRYRPHRLEPIYYLVEILHEQGSYAKAYEYLKLALAVPKPKEKDSLFNSDWIEKYGLLFQLSICSYYLGHYEESLRCCDELIAMKGLPESWLKQAISNRTFSSSKI